MAPRSSRKHSGVVRLSRGLFSHYWDLHSFERDRERNLERNGRHLLTYFQQGELSISFLIWICPYTAHRFPHAPHRFPYLCAIFLSISNIFPPSSSSSLHSSFKVYINYHLFLGVSSGLTRYHWDAATTDSSQLSIFWSYNASQPRDHEGDHPKHNHSGPIRLFCFSPLAQYSRNYVRYSTLYYKISFVLDDLAQLQANISVLNTFTVD